MRNHNFIVDDPALRVFRNTYWANFKSGDMTYTPEILAARRAFSQRHRLLRQITEPCLQRPFDHTEAYKCRGGHVVLITSPYNDPIDAMTSAGGKQIAHLYAPNAVTFEWTFPDVYAMRRFAKTLSREI